jgi:hypothetical protein
MFMADYRDGQWKNLRIVPYGPIQISPATPALHYGQSIFEGMKAYRADDGMAHWYFVPLDNLEAYEHFGRTNVYARCAGRSFYGSTFNFN